MATKKKVRNQAARRKTTAAPWDQRKEVLAGLRAAAIQASVVGDDESMLHAATIAEATGSLLSVGDVKSLRKLAELADDVADLRGRTDSDDLRGLSTPVAIRKRLESRVRELLVASGGERRIPLKNADRGEGEMPASHVFAERVARAVASVLPCRLRLRFLPSAGLPLDRTTHGEAVLRELVRGGLAFDDGLIKTRPAHATAVISAACKALEIPPATRKKILGNAWAQAAKRKRARATEVSTQARPRVGAPSRAATRRAAPLRSAAAPRSDG